MDRLTAALGRLSAAIDRLDSAAQARIAQGRQGDLLAGLGVAGNPVAQGELQDLERRLDHAIARLQAVLED